MNTQDKEHQAQQAFGESGKTQARIFAIGRAGVAVAEELINRGFSTSNFVAVCCEDTLSDQIAGVQKIITPSIEERDRQGHNLAEIQARLKTQLQESNFVLVVGALGGITGREFVPAVARIAKDAGHIVFGFVTLPFDCEGSFRQAKADAALRLLKHSADGVLCLPNQKLWKLIPENTPLSDAFKISDGFMADVVHGLWRMLTCKWLIEVHLTELCMVIGGPHNQTAFAVADVVGNNRARKAVEKLLANPTLDSGQVLRHAEAVVVGVFAGRDLAMAEVNLVVEQINRHCANIPIITGAAIDEALGSRLVLTLFAGRNVGRSEPALTTQTAGSTSSQNLTATSQQSDLEPHLVSAETGPRPRSRIVPPPPELTQDEMQQLLSRQNQKGQLLKMPARWRQGQLKLEMVSKGRFDKCEPTIYRGEDLDLPTYIRRGIVLN